MITPAVLWSVFFLAATPSVQTNAEAVSRLLPISPISSLVVTTGASGELTLSWTNPADHDGVLIVRAPSAVSVSLTDGATYSPGQQIGNGEVVFFSDGGSNARTFTDTGLTNNARYHYKVFNHDDGRTYASGNVPNSNGVAAEPTSGLAPNPVWCSSVGLASGTQPFTVAGAEVFQVSNARSVTANGVSAGAEKWRPTLLAGVVQTRPSVVQLEGRTGTWIMVGDQQGFAYAISAATGGLAWTGNGGVAIGERIQAQPAAHLYATANAAFKAANPNRDLIYFSTRNTSTTGNEVWALSSVDGTKVWKYAPGDLDITSGGMMIDAVRNRLWITSRAGASGTQPSLRVIDVLNPTTSIASFAIGDIDNPPIRNFDGTQTLVTTAAGFVFGYDRQNMTQSWSQNVGGEVAGYPVPVTDGFLVSTPTGVQRYTVNGAAVSAAWVSATAITNPTGPRVDFDSGKVYVGDSSGRIHRINLVTGVDEQQWALSSAGLGMPSLDLTTVPKRLYVSNVEGRLCGIDLIDFDVPVSSVVIAGPIVGTQYVALTPVTTSHTGGPATQCAISPPLPAGLAVTLVGGECVIAGTPTAVLTTPTVFTVTASNSGGTDSETVTLSVLPPIPVAPTSGNYADVLQISATITWDDNADNEASFVITRSTDNLTFSPVTVTAPNVESFADSGLSASTTYYYRVIARNLGGDSSATTTTFTTPPNPPAAPTAASITAVTSNSLTLHWVDNASDENGFVVQRSTDNLSFATVATPSANANHFDDSGLMPSTNYYYRVYATNAGGASASASTSATTALPPPSGLSFAAAPFNLTTNVPMTAASSTHSGGAIASCGVSPALPAGVTVVLNSGECLLSGTPTVATAAASYLITASNAGGSTSVSVNITVAAAAVPGQWTITGSLSVGRKYGAVQLLADGKLLAPGGYDGSSQDSSDLYNPATGTWSLTGAMSARRYMYAMALLGNGKVLVIGGQTISGYLGSAELYDPAAGTWSSTGAMNAIRYNHAAVVLPNGKVLAAGGSAGSGPVTSAELYDPVAGTWTSTGAMVAARAGHAMLLLANGKVLAVGGSGTASTELYDPATGIWTATGSTPTARQFPTLSLLSSGKVLVAQGGAGAETYDPATGVWTATGSPIVSRSGAKMLTLTGGKVLLAGGYSFALSTYFASAELFDPATGTWTATGAMNTGRTDFSMTTLANGDVIALGGGGASGYLASAEVYSVLVTPPSSLAFAGAPFLLSQNTLMTPARSTHSGDELTGCGSSPALPAGLTVTVQGNACVLSGTPTAASAASSFTITASNSAGSTNTSISITVTAATTPGQWVLTGPLSINRYSAGMALLPNGKVLISGGGDAISSAEIYDPATGVWTATGSMIGPRRFHSLIVLKTGKVLVAGGYSGGMLAGSELYDPSTGVWTATGALTTPRAYHTVALLPDGRVLAAGNLSGATNTAEIYNPTTGTWTATGTMTSLRTSHCMIVLPNGKVLASGGYNGTATTATAELFDPATGTWTATGSMNFVRQYHNTVLLLNGKVLAAGSYSGSKSSELYDPATGVWTTSGLTTLAYYSRMMATLPNGKVLYAGAGTTGADVYDPATGLWTQTGFSNATYGQNREMLVLPNGKVLTAGGSISIDANRTELYTP